MNKEKALSLAAAICSKKEHCSWEIQEKLVKAQPIQNSIP